MKSKLLAGAMTLVLIGCSEKQPENASIASASEAANAGGPDVALDAAPGIAFAYTYSFRLPDDRISKVQEEHAAACEALGLQRCRIADIRYRLDRDGIVQAETRFKLEPGAARKFGADAIVGVEKAEGVLTGANLNGENVGTDILASQHRSAGGQAEIERLEARLKQGGLDRRERAELLEQIGQLKGQLDNERNGRRAGEARIAWASVAFDYVGDGALPGIGPKNPFSNAWITLLVSGGTLLSVVLVTGAAILPWALLAASIIFLWRRLRGGRNAATTSAT